MRTPASIAEIDLCRARLNRRAVLKATAAFTAMAATGGLVGSRAKADGGSSRAMEWHEATSVSGASTDTNTIGFASDFPFTAVAPHWSGEVDFPACVELSVSDEGEKFSTPVVVGPSAADAGPPDRDGRVFGGLTLTRSGRFVRYRTMDADGNPARIPDLVFTCIDASGGQVGAAVAPPSFQAAATRPPIISRAEWGAGLAYGGKDRGREEWPPGFQTVRHIIVHHSETPSFRDPLVEIRSIHYYHAITRGWGDIGYNYLVDFMGNVYEGRVGGENAIGGHAYQYAHGSAGICCMGDFSSATATPEALAGLIWISAWAGRNLDPLGRSDFHEAPNLPTICAHRDVNSSACPGDALYGDLDDLRRAVAEVLASGNAPIPDPGYVAGDVVEVNVGSANLRTGPGTGFRISARLPSGTVMSVVDGPTTVGGYTWYRLRGAAGEGWAATTVISPSDAVPPIRAFGRGDRVFVNTDALNLRTKPALGAAVRATMPNNATAEVLSGPSAANGFNWYRIQSDYGTGWAVEQYLSSRSGGSTSRFSRGDAVEVATDRLNLRTAASVNAAAIAVLATGTRASVIGGPRTADGYTWLQLQSPAGSGWAVESYLRGARAAPAPAARFRRGETVAVDTDTLNLRSGPGTGADVIARLPTGTRGKILDGPKQASGFAWYRLSTRLGNGWCVETYLTDSAGAGEFAAGDNVAVDTDALKLRRSPGSGGAVLAVMLTGTTGVVLDGPRASGGLSWYRIRTAQGSGWCAGRYLAKAAAAAAASRKGDQMMVTSDGLRLRASPRLSASVLAALPQGRQAAVVDGPRSADGYTWLRIDTREGRGWCVAEYLRRTGRSGPVVGSRVRVIDGQLNMRAGPGLARSIVAVLPDRAVLEVVAGARRADGQVWWKVSSSRYGTGWVAAAFLGTA
ncbi:MAG: SH3 domain-containing protein [Chloroflexia bacterium]|nr:SH3 domain-containing protein [Chloroflexia bacterium]